MAETKTNAKDEAKTVAPAKDATDPNRRKNTPPKPSTDQDEYNWRAILLNVHQRNAKRTASALLSRLKELEAGIDKLPDPIKVSPKAWKKNVEAQQYCYVVKIHNEVYERLRQNLRNKFVYDMANKSYGESEMPERPVALNAGMVSGMAEDIDGEPDWDRIRWLLGFHCSLEIHSEKEA